MVAVKVPVPTSGIGCPSEQFVPALSPQQQYKVRLKLPVIFTIGGRGAGSVDKFALTWIEYPSEPDAVALSIYMLDAPVTTTLDRTISTPIFGEGIKLSEEVPEHGSLLI